MLLAILQEEELEFVKELSANGLTYEFVKGAMLNFGVYQPGVFADSDEKLEDEEKQENIYFFARDMNKLAQEGRYLKVWGRDDEIERIIHILSRKTKNNPIIVGEAGVGKTAIAVSYTHLDVYKRQGLRTKKYQAFLVFKKIISLMIDNTHNNPEGILEIYDLREQVIVGRKRKYSREDIINFIKTSRNLSSETIRQTLN